jgi:hypothetical protein
MTSINEQISNLGSKSTASQKEVQNLELSDPPTPEELEALNSLQVGDLYTLNGGTSVLVFREPLK